MIVQTAPNIACLALTRIAGACGLQRHDLAGQWRLPSLERLSGRDLTEGIAAPQLNSRFFSKDFSSWRAIARFARERSSTT